MMAEELIGGILSTDIARGKLRGYGLYVTTDRIIGVKRGFWKDEFIFGETIAREVLEDMGVDVSTLSTETDLSAIGGLSKDEAKKAIEQLEQKKDFEVRKEELKEISSQPKKGWFKRTFVWWGDLTIITARDTYAIRIIGGDKEGILKIIFTAFDKDKLIV